MSEQPKNIQDVLNSAIEAQNAGVPVDWQRLCLDTISAATKEVSHLEQQVAQLQNQVGILENPPEVSHDPQGQMQ